MVERPRHSEDAVAGHAAERRLQTAHPAVGRRHPYGSARVGAEGHGELPGGEPRGRTRRAAACPAAGGPRVHDPVAGLVAEGELGGGGLGHDHGPGVAEPGHHGGVGGGHAVGVQGGAGRGAQTGGVDDVLHADRHALQGPGRSAAPPLGTALCLLPGHVVVAGHDRAHGPVGVVDAGQAVVDHLDRVERPGSVARQQGRGALVYELAVRLTPASSRSPAGVGRSDRVRAPAIHPTIGGRRPQGLGERLRQLPQPLELVAQRLLGSRGRRQQLVGDQRAAGGDGPRIAHDRTVAVIPNAPPTRRGGANRAPMAQRADVTLRACPARRAAMTFQIPDGGPVRAVSSGGPPGLPGWSGAGVEAVGRCPARRPVQDPPVGSDQRPLGHHGRGGDQLVCGVGVEAVL